MRFHRHLFHCAVLLALGVLMLAGCTTAPTPARTQATLNAADQAILDAQAAIDQAQALSQQAAGITAQAPGAPSLAPAAHQRQAAAQLRQQAISYADLAQHTAALAQRVNDPAEQAYWRELSQWCADRSRALHQLAQR